ncbi:MAG: SGNH/GDSL hydrolase family protein [Lachnospiraceae bacterium]|nr:SGNH/GDSL hydrolase family protein [Lachnospiraceae bacterium]
MDKIMRRKQIVYVVLAVILLAALWVIPKSFNRQGQDSYYMVCLGDSMLAPVKKMYGVVDILEDKLQKPIYNGALGGTCLGRKDKEKRLASTHDSLSMVALAEAIAYEDFGPQKAALIRENGTDYFADTISGLAGTAFDKVDVVLIEHGTNDYNSGIPMVNEEDPYDEYSFAGALRKTVKILKEQLPGVRIILVTPTYCWFPQMGHNCETWQPAGATLEDYVELEKRLAKELGVEVIDHYPLFSHAEEADCYKYTVDGLHATELGRQMIADSIVQYLLENP